MAQQRSGGIGKQKISRRQFLTLSWWGLAGFLLSGLGGFTIWSLWPTKKSAFSQTVVLGGIPCILGPGKVAGNVNDLKVGDVAEVNKECFFVVRTETGILTLYNKCPHLGCAVPWKPGLPARLEEPDILTPTNGLGRFHCPCHGSQYDRLGVIREGPAPRPMDYFDPEDITIDEAGNIVVDTSKPVKRSSFDKETQVKRYPDQVKEV
ncbi:MAG: Rieske 2Fe-2S domain-containing protein [Dehalococcoidia bacterium]